MDNSFIKDLYSLSLGAKELAFVWLGYSGIILCFKDITLLFDISDFIEDPQIEDLKEPIITLYTHIHDDHFHLRTTLKLSEMKETIIITCPEVFDELKEFLPMTSLKKLEPKKGIKIGNTKIFALKGVHDCEHYIYYIIYNDIRVLHLGSSGYVPLSKIKSDIIFVPVGQPSSSASLEIALKITKDVKPQYAIPFHGNEEEINKYLRLVNEEKLPVKIIIPEKYKPVKLSIVK